MLLVLSDNQFSWLIMDLFHLISLGVTLWNRTLLEQVEHWQGYLALVNMILFCTGIPGHYPVNETTSSLTLTFWYTLQVCTLHPNLYTLIMDTTQ